MKWRLPWTKETKASQGNTRSIILDNLANDFLGCSLTGEKITPQKAMGFYRQNSSIATAVDMIADSFEQITPVIMLEDGTMIEKHPVLDLLNSPNAHMTWSDFAARISRHYLLTNQTHFFGLGAITLSPSQVFPVKPTGVSVTTGGSEYVDVYYIGQGTATGTYTVELAKQHINRYYDGPLKELYRIAGFSSMSTDGSADSPIQAAALETNQQIKGRIHNLKMLDNGGRMSLLIIFKDEQLDDDAHRERTKRINETLAGPENAGKIGVMSGGDVEKVEEMGVNNKDMDYVELDKIASQSIYFRYKIPLPLITTTASTFNNMTTAIEMLYDFAVLPHADKLFAGLTRFLLPRFGIELGSARITYNPESLQPLKARRLDELKKRKDIGVETTNELRELIPNRDDVEGGDVIYQNATQVPIGTDINADPDAPPARDEVDE